MKRIKITIVLLIAVSLLSIVVTLCMGAVQIPVDDTPGGEELHRAKALSGRYERAFKAEGTEGRAS